MSAAIAETKHRGVELNEQQRLAVDCISEFLDDDCEALVKLASILKLED